MLRCFLILFCPPDSSSVFCEEHRLAQSSVVRILLLTMYISHKHVRRTLLELVREPSDRSSVSHACAIWRQVVDAHTLEAVENARNQPTLIAVAAFFGTVRLIDNLEVS